MLQRGEPYPQVILPEFGGYWIEDPPLPLPTCVESKGEEEERVKEDTLPGDYGYQLEDISDAARTYRKHFLGRVR